MDPVNLIDLPIEVLLRILSFLNVSSLLNIFNTSKYLRMVSQCDLRAYTPSFQIIGLYLSDYSYIITLNRYPKRCSLGFILIFLRCFGHSIKKLTLDVYCCSEDEIQTVFCYINRHCENLEIIEFSNIFCSVGRTLKKPFKKIKEIRIGLSLIKGRLLDFKRWFPNLEKIVISDMVRFEKDPNFDEIYY